MVTLCSDSFKTPSIVVHESGHFLLNLPDEYDVPTTNLPECGHSLMANQYPPWSNGFCTTRNHGKDAQIGAPPIGDPRSAWSYINGLGIMPVEMTDHFDDHDDYNYADFRFAGAMQTIAQYK